MSRPPESFIRGVRVVDRQDYAPAQPYHDPPRSPYPVCPTCRSRMTREHARYNAKCGKCLTQAGEPIRVPKWVTGGARQNAAAQQRYRDRLKAEATPTPGTTAPAGG